MQKIRSNEREFPNAISQSLEQWPSSGACVIIFVKPFVGPELNQTHVNITTRNLAVLFIASLVPFTVGAMLTNLLPLYADELGASDGTTGFLMASVFLAVAGGTAFSGWLSDVHGLRKTVLLLSGITNVFGFGLMGLAQSLEAVVVLTLLNMFFIGAGQNTISVLVGLLAAKHERGRAFGVVGLTYGLGLLIGGFGSGPIVEQGGFPTLFFTAAIIFVIQPLAIMTLQEEAPVPQQFEVRTNSQNGATLGLAFYVFSAASLLSFAAQFVGVLGRPLVMDSLGFSIITISIAFGASGAVVAPLTLLAGRASDRVARKPLIMLAYTSTAIGLLLMVRADSRWEFILSAMLLPAVNVSLVIGLALITDLVPAAMYGRAISIYNSTVWVGAIIGFTTAGSAIGYLGSEITLTIAFGLSVVAILFLLTVREPILSEN